KAGLHYTIGTYIYRSTAEPDLREKIFYIVNQLDAGISRIKSREEQRDIARLNLVAGKKAKDSAAYQSAWSYFRVGVSLLEESDWQDNYKLAHELYLQAAEACCFNAAYSEMEKYLAEVLLRSGNLLDRTKAYEIKIRACMAQNQLKEAAQTTKEILTLLGLRLPEKISKKKIAWELYKTKWCLRRMGSEDFKALSHMTDPYALASIRIANSAGAAFYAGGYTMDLILIVLKMVRLTVRRGIAPQSPFYLSSYAMVLHPLNQFEAAFHYTDIALALREKLGITEIRTKYLIYCYLDHWRGSIRQSLETLLDIYYSGFEVGDLEYSLVTANHYCYFLFSCGKELDAVDQELDRIKDVTARYKMETAYNYNAILHQVVQNLRGNAQNLTVIKGDRCNGDQMQRRYKAVNDRLGLFLLHLHASQLKYFFGEIEQAAKEMDETRKYLDAGSGGLYHFSLFYFYRALILLAGLKEVQPGKQRKIIKKVWHYNSKLKSFARYAPMNFEHKHLLLSAELARVRGDVAEAQDFYEKSAQKAFENEYVQEEALACELAGLFHLQRGFEAIAGFYLNRAVACFARWGAEAKVKQIKSGYARLLSYSWNVPAGITTTQEDAETSGSGGTMVDLHAVLKASRALAGEIVLEKLLEQLMKIAIENAGAERGALFFEKEGELFVEAMSDISGHIEIPGSVPLEAVSGIPRSVINYVRKTNENLVLANACEDERFVRDSYIEKKGVKSILCAPIRQKSEAVAILYLENNWSTNAFTPERLELLRVISSQAAISIENARLFEVARRDGLTELINHRYFQYSLQKEIEAASGNNHKVSLLMLDIDFFKKFNDTFGHQAGDRVLKEVAAVLRQNAPDKDLAGRYGGEEFAVIVPRKSDDEARALAEKIRCEIENRTVKIDSLNESVPADDRLS
ncbi:MAG: diguanylate cyclase, partial [Desulfovibrionales bacterium]